MFQQEIKDIVISMSEIIIVAKQEGLPIVTYDDLKDLLWLMGMDIDYRRGFENRFVEHRNRMGDVVTCTRFWGMERTDDDYLILKEV